MMCSYASVIEKRFRCGQGFGMFLGFFSVVLKMPALAQGMPTGSRERETRRRHKNYCLVKVSQFGEWLAVSCRVSVVPLSVVIFKLETAPPESKEVTFK